MILADTSVWVDHLRVGDPDMHRLLTADEIALHPYVFGEIVLGYLHPRRTVMDTLSRIPGAEVAEADEVVDFIERYQLFGLGIGYVDVHLLASAALSFCRLWTRDKKLRSVAEKLGLAVKGLN